VDSRVKYLEYGSRILTANQKENRKEETKYWFQNEKIRKLRLRIRVIQFMQI
jgi:hypothetical protein